MCHSGLQTVRVIWRGGGGTGLMERCEVWAAILRHNLCSVITWSNLTTQRRFTYFKIDTLKRVDMDSGDHKQGSKWMIILLCVCWMCKQAAGNTINCCSQLVSTAPKWSKSYCRFKYVERNNQQSKWKLKNISYLLFIALKNSVIFLIKLWVCESDLIDSS